MSQKKVILSVLVVAFVATVIVLGATSVRAQAKNNNPFSGLIQMIAQKFGLDQAQVQSVFDQYHQQQQQNRQQQMQQHLEDRLNQAVSQGKINSQQKQAILDELTKLKNEYIQDSLKNLTPQKRKQTLQKR